MYLKVINNLSPLSITPAESLPASILWSSSQLSTAAPLYMQ